MWKCSMKNRYWKSKFKMNKVENFVLITQTYCRVFHFGKFKSIEKIQKINIKFYTVGSKKSKYLFISILYWNDIYANKDL